MLSSTVPSEWARNLVRGAYDLHVHVAPDVMRRRVTDVQLARRRLDAAGLLRVKSHYVPTAERAAVVNEALGGEVRVLGAALNAPQGTRSRRPGRYWGWSRHQLVVATGHLSAFETRAVADAALAASVRHVIATHPDFPQQDMGLDDQLALARQGVFLERCSARRTRACATGPAWSPISGPPGQRRRS